MRKKGKKLTALLLTGAMMLSMGVPVFATVTPTPPIPTTDPEKAMTAADKLSKSYLTKNLVIDHNLTCPVVTFTFDFKKIGVNEDAHNEPETKVTEMPDLAAKSITYTEDDTAIDTTGAHDGTTIDDVSADFKDPDTIGTEALIDTRTKGINLAYILGIADIDGKEFDDSRQYAGHFTHAGEYAYEVSEKANAYTEGTNEIYQQSLAKYRLRVFVVNLESGDPEFGTAPNNIKIAGVTVTRITEQDGTVLDGTTGKETVKVDPDPDSNGAHTDKYETSTSFAFENSLIKKSSLNVKKTVTNTYGDKTKKFPFSLTLTLPASTKNSILTNISFAPGGDGKITAEIWSGTGTEAKKIATAPNTVEFTFTDTASGITATKDFLLSDGQYLHFEDSLPVGTTYTVKESLGTDMSTTLTGASVPAQYANYTPKADVTFNATTAVEDTTGVKGTDYSLNGDGANATINTTVGETNKEEAGADTKSDISSNLTNITNNYEEVTITGILMNNLPFIILIVVALGGLVGYVAMKRKIAR